MVAYEITTLSVCVPPKTFEPVGGLYEIQQTGHAIEGDLNAAVINPVASRVSKWRRIKLLRWIQKL
jgi:hypothetical protein